MLLLPTWSIYLLTSRFIYGNGEFEIGSKLILAGITLITIGAYFINQIYDFETDRINKKLGFLQQGLINKNEMMAAFIVASIFPPIAGFAVDIKIGLIMMVMVLLGIAYSVPPIRLKDRPLGGLMANAIAYGALVPLSVPGFMDSADISRIFIVICFFMMVAAGYLLTVIPDRQGDRKSEKSTLAIRWSDRPIILLALAFLLVASYSAHNLNNILLVIICSVSIVLFILALLIGRNSVIFFACKFPILLLSLLAGYYFPTYFVFLLVLLILTRLYYNRRFGIVYPRLI